jgi:tripartite-type tricarboxylate transporter receptor subunit TctC
MPPTAAIKVRRGRLAQLVEHLVYTERVGGSSPSPPTTASVLPNYGVFKNLRMGPVPWHALGGEKMARLRRFSAFFVLVALNVVSTGMASAQSAASFYIGKTVNLIVGSTPGGYYDIAGRVVARHFGQYIPGHPNVIVQNQPGGAGLASVNKIGNAAERDGRTILVMSRALPQLALVGDPNAAFDPLQLTWLGSLSSYKDDAYLVTINSSHPAKSLADVRPPGKPIYLGGTRGGSTNIIFALLARDMLKLNFEVTKGYPGAAQIWLAMERGEVDGQIVDISAIMVGRPKLWEEGKLRPLLAFGRTERLPDRPEIPIARDLVTDANDLALLEFAELPFFMALPFVAPPDIPPDRARLLKDAFMTMAMNETFRADMKKAGIMTSPIDGDAVHGLIAKAAKTPEAVRAGFAKLLAEK